MKWLILMLIFIMPLVSAGVYNINGNDDFNELEFYYLGNYNESVSDGLYSLDFYDLENNLLKSHNFAVYDEMFNFDVDFPDNARVLRFTGDLTKEFIISENKPVINSLSVRCNELCLASWSALDIDNDNLTFDVYYGNDEWNVLEFGIKDNFIYFPAFLLNGSSKIKVIASDGFNFDEKQAGYSFDSSIKYPALVDKCSVLNEKNRIYILNSDIINNTLGLNAKCINIAAKNITLDCQNNKISGDSADLIYSNQPYTRIENCILSGSLKKGKAINLERADNSIIINNTAINKDYGINLYFIANSSVENNYLSGNNFGIRMYAGLNNSIVRNFLNNNLQFGFYFQAGSNNNLIGNSVNLNGYAIYSYYSDKNNFISNIANENQYPGIYIYSSSGSNLADNYINGNKYPGVYLYRVYNSNLINNTIIFNRAGGVYLYSSFNNSLEGNTINFNNGNGIYSYPGYGYTITGLITGFGTMSNSVNNNNICNNTYQDIYCQNSGMIGTGNKVRRIYCSNFSYPGNYGYC